jgi:regulator of nucleoside diphosphate kinase
MKNGGVIMTAKPILSRWDYAQLQIIAANAEGGPTDRESLHALQRILDSALVLHPDDIPADVVTMHSKVRLLDHRSDSIIAFTLVYPNGVASEDGKLSVLAPLGLAILGRRAGDLVEWPGPSGWARFTLVKVTYQPEVESRCLERMSMGPPLRLTR